MFPPSQTLFELLPLLLLQCWCGDDDYDRHGKISEAKCDYPCTGDESQDCGGFYALSVYSTY